MRKLALSSRVYNRYRLGQAIRHVALAGFSGIGIVADAPHGYPPLMTDADRKGIQAALAQNRLAVSNINAAPMTALRERVRPSWIESDVVLRKERIQHTLDAARFARDLGAPTVSTLAGGQLEDEMPRDKALKHFIAGLKEVCTEVAKRKYPPVLIDPEPGLLVSTVAEALEVIAAVKSQHLGVTLNTGFLHRGGQDLPAAVRRAAAMLRHIHVADLAGDGSGTVVVPGTGVVDFSALFAALDEVGYEGWLTIDLSGADVHPDEAARQARQFLGQFEK